MASRKTRADRTIRRAHGPRQQEESPKRPLFRSKLVKLLAFVIGAPGVLAALLSLLPRLAPTVSDPVDPDDPFSSSVTITNTGYIPLDAVYPGIAVCEIAAKGTPTLDRGPCDYSNRWHKDAWNPRNLGLDDRFTFALNDVWETKKGALAYADVAVTIDYEIPIIHWKRTKVFPLVARMQTNGRFYWYAK